MIKAFPIPLGLLNSFNIFLNSTQKHGLIQITAITYQTFDRKKRSRTQLRCQSHVWYNPMDSGWRIYMEDAHINNSPLSDKKNSIFGVFDGHGGFDFSMQVHKFRHLWNAILSNNLKEIRITKRKITKKHLKKLSLKWISFCSQKQAKNRSSLYKNK